MKLRDKLWLWGQDAGSHHRTLNNMWNLPGENKMEPVEGCDFFGISNCCRVVMGGLPKPPFDADAAKYRHLDRVVWSIIGDTNSERNNDETDLEEVIRIAAKQENICGAIMDDFMNEKRLKIFTPEKLAEMQTRLHTAVPGKPLDLWNVLYLHEMSEKIVPWLHYVDKITVWAWCAKELYCLDEDLAKLENYLRDDPKPILAGCYLYDYGESKPMPMDAMKYQLELYRKWLHEKRIDGVVLLSNAIADIGLEAVDYAKEWIEQHGDEYIPD